MATISSATAPSGGADVSDALERDVRAFTDALGEMVRVVQFRDRDRACCHDLSVTQCYALEGVVDAGGLTVNELAAHLFLDKSTVSRVARGLVERELVVREADAADGRVVRLVATVRGMDVHRAIAAELMEEYRDMLVDLDPDARASVVRVVERIGSAFSRRVDVQGGSCCVVR